MDTIIVSILSAILGLVILLISRIFKIERDIGEIKGTLSILLKRFNLDNNKEKKNNNRKG